MGYPWKKERHRSGGLHSTEWLASIPTTHNNRDHKGNRQVREIDHGNKGPKTFVRLAYEASLTFYIIGGESESFTYNFFSPFTLSAR